MFLNGRSEENPAGQAARNRTPNPHSERFFTVGQIASRRNLSTDTVRRIFTDEPGVVVISKPKANRRTYRSLRIPESVEQRVFGRMTN